MSLLKKTVVLTNNGAEGYITVVRVGDEVGAKIVGSSFKKGMLAAIKIGTEPIIYAKLDGERTEININIAFNQNDEISCLIMQKDVFIAKAGRSLSKRELYNYFISEETLNTPNAEIESVAANVAQDINETSKIVNTQPIEKIVTSPNWQQTDEISPKPISQTVVSAKVEKNIKTEPKEESVTSPISNKDKTSEAESIANTNDIVAPTVSETPKTEVSESVEKVDTEVENEFLSRLHSSGTKNFYLNVKERLEDLFIIHPRENELEKIIPESKWVKIRYDGDDYYVVGSLADDGTVAYLAYGVPGVAEVPPPKLASDISDWLPVPNLPPPYKGYWLIFQNAEDGRVGNIK